MTLYPVDPFQIIGHGLDPNAPADAPTPPQAPDSKAANAPTATKASPTGSDSAATPSA